MVCSQNFLAWRLSLHACRACISVGLKVKCQVSLFARMWFRMLYAVVTDVSAKNQESGFCVFFLVFSLSLRDIYKMKSRGEIED